MLVIIVMRASVYVCVALCAVYVGVLVNIVCNVNVNATWNASCCFRSNSMNTLNELLQSKCVFLVRRRYLTIESTMFRIAGHFAGMDGPLLSST